MSSVRRASNGLLHRQIIRRITWIVFPNGLIPTVLLCLLALLYWRSFSSQPSIAFLQLIVGLSALSLLVEWLTSWMTARRLAFTMEKLAEAMEKFASGQWDQRAIVRQSDPLVKLALLFNQIADDYRSSYQSLTVHQPEGPQAHRQALAQISSLVISAQSQDDLMSGALETIGRTVSSKYAAIYLLEEDSSHQKRYLNLTNFHIAPDFKPSSLKSPEGSPPAIMPDILGVRIALDKTGQLDWPLKLAVTTGKSVIQEAASNSEVVEAAVPLLRTGKVIGVMDLFVPMLNPEIQGGAFSSRTLWEVEQAAGLIALAVEHFQQAQVTELTDYASTRKTGLPDERSLALYQAGSRITQAVTEQEALESAAQALECSLYPCALLLSQTGSPDQLQAVYVAHQSGTIPTTDEWLAISAVSLAACFNSYTPAVITALKPDEEVTHDLPTGGPVEGQLPRPLLDLAGSLGCKTAAFLPVMRNEQVYALITVGLPGLGDQGTTSQFFISQLEPYRNLVEVLASSLENIRSAVQTQRQLAELRTFWNVSQAISIETDLDHLFLTIHRQLETVLGDLGSFAIALYEAEAETIRIPYMIEEGSRLEVAPFPLGEGLTSILVRSGKPLLLREDVEAQSKALGAKVLGEPAKSWLGAPMLYSGEVIGAIILQDILHAGRFNEDDQRLLSALASEVAVVVHNARLLETSRSQARQERAINEITAKIRRSSDIQTILKSTAVELGSALGVQKAHIRLGFESEPAGTEGGGGQ